MLPAIEAAWIQFYTVIMPYSRDGALDHVLISKLCEAEGIDFLEAFEYLTYIHEQVLENQKDGRENEGIHTGSEKDEATGVTITR
jgi:hypothetical protein